MDDTRLVGTNLTSAKLQGAWFDNAILRGANLTAAHLEESNLKQAQLQGADASSAHLNRAWLVGTQFQGAILLGAEFYGAEIASSQFQGANLDASNFRGVFLVHSNFQGATVRRAGFQAVIFKDVHLEGAIFDNSGLQGASFQNSFVIGTSFRAARLQGIVFDKGTKLALSEFFRSNLWRAVTPDCNDAQVTEPKFDPVIGLTPEGQQIAASAEGLEAMIKQYTAPLSESDRNRVATVFRDELSSEGFKPESGVIWQKCAEHSLPKEVYEKKLQAYLIGFVCVRKASAKFVAERIFLSVAERVTSEELRTFSAGLIDADGQLCPGAKDIDPIVSERVRKAAIGNNS